MENKKVLEEYHLYESYSNGEKIYIYYNDNDEKTYYTFRDTILEHINTPAMWLELDDLCYLNGNSLKIFDFERYQHLEDFLKRYVKETKDEDEYEHRLYLINDEYMHIVYLNEMIFKCYKLGYYNHNDSVKRAYLSYPNWVSLYEDGEAMLLETSKNEGNIDAVFKMSLLI